MITYDLDWNGDEVLEVLGVATADGLVLATEFLAQVSSARAPHEEGTLERSAKPTVDRDELIGAVSFDTVYAARQHEELEWRHAPGRTAKYLENPAIEERATIVQLIAAPPRAAVAGA